MTPTSERSTSTMCGPWKLLRIVFKTLLFGALAWFFLALLWAFLPSPSPEKEGDNGVDYASSVLRAGKTLIRVYESKNIPTMNDRDGFALDFEVDVSNLMISIGGHVVPIVDEKWLGEWDENIEELAQTITVTARTGDSDGANLPWFRFADAVLLFWWIHKESRDLELSLQWKVLPAGARRLEIHTAVQALDDLLFSVEIQDGNPATIVAAVPEVPLSSSPSSTYPLRVAIIHVIAPTAIFVNDFLGNSFGVIIETIVAALFVGAFIFFYAFMLFAVIFSLWRILRGPSFEVVMDRVHGRLETLSENERLRILNLDAVQKKLDALCRNERFMGVLDVCRNGWHPERSRAKALEEAANIDIENAREVKVEGEGGISAEGLANKK